jgi:hypothetical protein
MDSLDQWPQDIVRNIDDEFDIIVLERTHHRAMPMGIGFGRRGCLFIRHDVFLVAWERFDLGIEILKDF